MATGQLGGAIRYLRRILQANDADGLGDAELLERFVQDRDEAAFEALVRRHEVAQQIGCPEGTLSSRLARAREMLRGRLERRGLALSVGSLALVLSQNAAPAAVPASLAAATVQAVAASAFAAPVVALTEGV